MRAGVYVAALSWCVAIVGCEEPPPRFAGPELPRGSEAHIASVNAFGWTQHAELLEQSAKANVVLSPSTVIRTTSLADPDVAKVWSEIDPAWLADDAWRDWERIHEPGVTRRIRLSLWSRDLTKKRQRDAEQLHRARAGVLSGEAIDDRPTIEHWGRDALGGKLDRVLDKASAIGREVAVGTAVWSADLRNVQRVVTGPFQTPAGPKDAVFGDVDDARAYQSDTLQAYGVVCATSRYEFVVFPDRTTVKPSEWATLRARSTAALRLPALRMGAHSSFQPVPTADIRHAAWLRVGPTKADGSGAPAAATSKRRIVLDRPFAFAVRDRRTGLILVLGTAFSPES